MGKMNGSNPEQQLRPRCGNLSRRPGNLRVSTRRKEGGCVSVPRAQPPLQLRADTRGIQARARWLPRCAKGKKKSLQVGGVEHLQFHATAPRLRLNQRVPSCVCHAAKPRGAASWGENRRAKSPHRPSKEEERSEIQKSPRLGRARETLLPVLTASRGPRDAHPRHAFKFQNLETFPRWSRSGGAPSPTASLRVNGEERRGMQLRL